MIRKEYELSYSPVFIVGVPRSGTTLLYQVLSHSFDVCYFSNLLAKYSDIPCTLSYVLSILNLYTPINDFKSYYGDISGWRSPSQAQLFWSRWFSSKDQNYVGKDEVPESMLLELRNTILLLQKIYNKPFVNKALSLGVRIQPISRAFPEALFVRIHRNHIDSAQSILRGRNEYAGDKNRWISSKPSEYEKIEKTDNISQVCGQIFYIEKDMDRDFRSIGDKRCFHVSYKELCKNPEGVIGEIERFYNTNSFMGKMKRKFMPPKSFNYSSGRKCNEKEYYRIKETFLNYLDTM